MSRRPTRCRSRLICQRLEDRTLPATFMPHTVAELRQDIVAANQSTDATSEIILDKNGTYTLTDADPLSSNGAGLPTISPPPNHVFTITGNGATLTRDPAAPQFRLAQATNGGSLIIDNLTFSNGSTNGNGGALWAFTSGTSGVNLTLDGCIFKFNTSSEGGAVNYRSTGLTFLAKNSSFQSNTSTDAGGAVELTDGLPSLIDCSFTSNQAAGDGGGLWTETGNAQVSGCTFSGNQSTGGDSHGGGLYNSDQISISNSTFTANRAANGGGIGYENNGNNLSSFSIASSTVVGNTAFGNNPFGSSGGGGLYTYYKPVVGDVFRPATVVNTVIAGNTLAPTSMQAKGPDVYAAGNGFTSNDYNFIGVNGVNTNDQFTAPHDRTGTTNKPLDPQLNALADNGGPTLTVLPKPGSPVIDAGQMNYNGPLMTDQRGLGFPRVLQGGNTPPLRIDIGATEFAPPDLVVTNTDNTDTAVIGQTTTYTVIISNLGDAAIIGATVTDPLPAGVKNFTWMASTSGGITATPANGTGAVSASVNLPSRSSIAFTVTATIDPRAASGSLVNVASATGPVGFIDPTPADNTNVSDTDTLVAPSADLAVTLTSTTSTVTAGHAIALKLTVSNAGPVAVAGATLNAPVPAGATAVTWTSTAAGGATGNRASGSGAIAETLSLPANASVTYTVTLTAGATVPATITYQANAAVPTGFSDPNQGNNSRTLTLTVADGGPIYATGSDAGTPATVNVYSARTGALLRSFQPFGSGFRGGARVATGDFNGDGVPDVVAAAGPGGGPAVLIFDGMTGRLILSFYAFEPTFPGGVYVAAGDLTGDGVPDVAVGSGPGGGSRVRVFDGKTGSQIVGALGSFNAYGPQFQGGVRVAVGDVDGDQSPDLITAAGPGGGPHVVVYSRNAGYLQVIRSFYAYAPTYSGGVYVAAADVNGDGKAEIVAGPGNGQQPVKVFNGADLSVLESFSAYGVNLAGGVRVAAADVDGDGKADLITGAGAGGSPHVRVLKGTDLGQVRQFFAFDPSFLGGVFVG